MDARSAGPVRRRIGALLTAVTLGAATLIGTSVMTASAAPPPSNPTDAQLNAAQAAKTNLANLVGSLSASIAQAQEQVRQLGYAYELAQSKFVYAQSQLELARAESKRAQIAVTLAHKAVATARANLTNFVHDSYVSPSIASPAGGLLTARDPNALLQRGDYLQYVSLRHLDAMSALDTATVEQANASTTARAAVVKQRELTDAANLAQQAAQQAYQAEQSQAAQLQTQLVANQAQLLAAQQQLATLNGQRAAFVAYQQEQARIAAEKARLAAAARARAAAAAAAAAAARARAEAAASRGSGSGSHSGSGSGSGSSPLPPAGSMGGWSPAKGRAAVARAERWIGQPYSWAGGNYNGPTYGVNSPGTDGWNDSQVYGFDCSGLTMYAWAAQGLYLSHYAASQFSEAGSFHPDSSQFQPGDLLFWGLPGQGSIHHVAMYVGGGDVIQAPNSGDVVKITPWDQVSGDYFGATRPLS